MLFSNREGRLCQYFKTTRKFKSKVLVAYVEMYEKKPVMMRLNQLGTPRLFVIVKPKNNVMVVKLVQRMFSFLSPLTHLNTLCNAMIVVAIFLQETC